MLVLTKKEKEFKKLNDAEEIIQGHKKKIEDKLIFFLMIPVSKEPDYKNILGKLEIFLKHSSHRWVSLHFLFKYKKEQPNESTESFVEEERVLFGRKKFIEKHLKEITNRMIKGKLWHGEGAGISNGKRFGIKDFI